MCHQSTGYICPKCADKLFHLGIPAYGLCYNICAATANGLQVYMDLTWTGMDEMLTIVKYLESKNYIVSTETDINELAIRPNPRASYFHPEIKAYCWCVPEKQESTG